MKQEQGPWWQKAILFGGVVFAIYSFVWSDIGVVAHTHMQEKAIRSRKKLFALKNDIAKLERKIAKFENDRFYTMKLAREDLLMAYPEEVVYVVKES
jgi:cell division protein FtsB